MKRGISLITFSLGVTLFLMTATALAYGFDLAHPIIRRTLLTQGYHSDHQAHDYRTSHTPILAPRAGEVTASFFGRPDGWEWPCDGRWEARGNHLILAHSDGIQTEYFHLSNTGSTPGVGQNFELGEYMALSDDTGCSSGDHLHFAVKQNGAPVNPTGQWVSGEPIPMGYMKHNDNLNGPFPLDRALIRDKWVELEGRLGSPLGHDYWEYISPRRGPAPLVPERTYIQDFERGYIFYTGSGPAYSHEFDQRVYLPYLWVADSSSDWYTYIVVRNQGNAPATVNLRLFNADGTVRDTRTYPALPGRASWTLDVRQIVFDPLLDDGYWFYGSAEVISDLDLTVVVENRRPGVVASNYTGFAALGQGGNPDWGRIREVFYAPTVKYWHYGRITDLMIMNAGSVETDITVRFYDDASGSQVGVNSSCSNLEPYAYCKVTPANYGPEVMGGIISSDPPVPLAAIAFERDASNSQVSGHNLMGLGASVLYSPLIKYRSYFDQTTGLRIMNVGAVNARVTVEYYRDDGSSALVSATCGRATPRDQRCVIPLNGTVQLVGDGLPVGFQGSARITSSQPVVAESMHEGGLVRKMASSVFHATTRTNSYAVRVCQGCNSNEFITGIRVQNVGSGSANVTIRYYDRNGAQVGSVETLLNLPRYRSRNATRVPNNLDGSAWIYSSNPLVVLVNLANADTNKDLTMTYNAPNR